MFLALSDIDLWSVKNRILWMYFIDEITSARSNLGRCQRWGDKFSFCLPFIAGQEKWILSQQRIALFWQFVIVLLEGSKIFYHDIFDKLCITRNDSRLQKLVVSDVRNIVEFAVRSRNENWAVVAAGIFTRTHLYHSSIINPMCFLNMSVGPTFPTNRLGSGPGTFLRFQKP